jgi:hypothetical protein
MAVEWGSQASLLGGAVEWGTQENELLVVEPTVIGFASPPYAGRTVDINIAGFESPPTSVTFGGTALTINSASTAVVNVTLLTRQTFDEEWGNAEGNLNIVVSNDDETATGSDYLRAPPNWNYFYHGATNPVAGEDSLYLARLNDELAPHPVLEGDQWQWTGSAGVTVDSLSRIFVSEGNYPATITYTLYSTNAPVTGRFDEHTLTIVEPDGTPNPYSFTNATNATPSATVTSNTLTLTGFNVPILVSVENGLISVNGGTFTAADTELEPGQTLALRGTASSEWLGVNSVSVMAGGVSSTWTITTQGLPEDGTPNDFSFTDVGPVTAGSTVTSNTLTLTGFDVPIPVSVVGGLISINGAAFTASASPLSLGQTLRLQGTASLTNAGTTNVTVTAGGVSDTWTITTADIIPDQFSFDPVNDAALSANVTSNTITVSGMDAGIGVSASVVGGGMSINGSGFIGGSTLIQNGQTVRLAAIASASYSTAVTVTLTINGVSADFVVTTLAAPDTTPDAFNFNDATGAELSTLTISNSITPIGYNSAAAITVSGGEYSIDGGAFTSSAGTISPASSVRVRATSSGAYSTAVSVTLTIGGVSDTWTVTTRAEDADTTPDAFSFTPASGLALSTLSTSNAITVAGINAPADISIVGGEYSINGGAYTSAAGSVTVGQQVTVRLTSSASYSTPATATLTIGGVSGSYTVTTQAEPADTTPDAFSFPSVSGVEISSVNTSASATITGINAPAQISVIGGTYSIGAGAFTAASGTITNGQSVRVRLTASGELATATSATLTIGGVSATYTATTLTDEAISAVVGDLSLYPSEETKRGHKLYSGGVTEVRITGLTNDNGVLIVGASITAQIYNLLGVAVGGSIALTHTGSGNYEGLLTPSGMLINNSYTLRSTITINDTTVAVLNMPIVYSSRGVH